MVKRSSGRRRRSEYDARLGSSSDWTQPRTRRTLVTVCEDKQSIRRSLHGHHHGRAETEILLLATGSQLTAWWWPPADRLVEAPRRYDEPGR
ncbi:hypothetical protein KZ779_07725 [Escherichia coli]|nr:hypothetical protein [Escherichia coli]